MTNDAGNYLEQHNYYLASRQRYCTGSDAAPELTFFVWSGATIIAEYAGANDTNVPLTWQKSYFYVGSRLLSTTVKTAQGEVQ